MRTTAWILLAVVVGAGVMLLWRRPEPTPVPSPGPAAESSTPSNPARSAAAPAAVAGPPGQGGTGTPTVVDIPETPAAPAATVRVPANRVLAKVNGQPLSLKDLMPLEPVETERSMTPEEWQSRLQRAIELELTFQAAAAQGMELTAEQKQRLESRDRHREATLAEYKLQGITWSSATASQIAFENRVATGLMLQQNLIAKAASAAPSPDPAAQARFEAARRAWLGALRAGGKVELVP